MRLCHPARPPRFAAKTIKIGALSPLTGLYSIVGKRTSQGINLAVKEINDAGGVLGHKFEALIRDSETNPASSVRTARRLILRDKVFALLGPLHGGAAIAVLQESKKLKTMNFPWAATEEINTKFCSRYTWRVGSSAQQTSRAGAVIAHRLGYKTWATISSDFSYGRSVVRQFWNYLKERDPGAKRPYAAWPKLGENDYSAYINKMQKAKPDAIFVGLFGADLIKFMKQARSFGMYEKVKIFTDFGGNHVVLKALGAQAPFGHWASSRLSAQLSGFRGQQTLRGQLPQSVQCVSGHDGRRGLFDRLRDCGIHPPRRRGGQGEGD